MFTISQSYIIILQGMRYKFGSAGASWRALGLKKAGAHSTRSLKISGCKRWCPKDLLNLC